MYKLLFLTLFSFFVVCTFAQTVNYPSRFTVAKDGSGDFKTIQEAVNAVRDLSQQQVTIYIKNGVYNEKLVIPSWKKRISLVGQSKDSTVICNDDYSGKAYPGGKDAFGKDKFTTYTSYTVLVQGDDCSIENLSIKNTAGRVGQAVALHVEGDRFVAVNCILTGNQDTLYTATNNSRQYYKDCYIEGTTDFIFGEATVVFRNCTIKSLTNSYITAASTTPMQKFGYVFFDCRLVADSSATKVLLGRPWRPNAKTVFINTEMGSHIHPVAWDNWRNPENERTVLYAEYKSRGEGAKIKERAKWSKQLSRREVKKYTLEKIFNLEVSWIPRV
ncbi:pectinesterase family protein [Chitinophagaceae bacterium LB-8]|uniref:Pectinesterase n=1 Tax=Paraflavisolibacter caeni TaxID=2982496 RepID=A0A9X2XS41_9BACT|nr:pectinesterase family protein [Paraflavisolibacter caeni]MCU7547796.1 pectinesterase family protein [Paraflavisolibacter caeni]